MLRHGVQGFDSWLIKRWLVLCLKSSNYPEMMQLMLNCLDELVRHSEIVDYIIRKGLNSHSKISFQVLYHINILGYYIYLRTLLDNDPKELIGQILNLVYRPFQTTGLSQSSQDIIMSEFCSNFLKPTLTQNVKKVLIPYLKNKRDFPFEKMIRYLNNNSYHFQSSNSLFYCILALEPDDYGKYYLIKYFSDSLLYGLVFNDEHCFRTNN